MREFSNRPTAVTPTAPTSEQLAQVFALDAQLTTPAFQQLHDRVVHAVTTGTLAPGQKLPTVRALAETMNLAPNTIAKAYKSLEAAHIIVGKGRSGTFVRLATHPVEAAAQQLAHETAQAFTALGIAEAHATQLLTQAFSAQNASTSSA